MLSYRHSFHAGNHADVIKHIVQGLILQSLTLKDKPFVYHDTHSGVGRYDLSHEWSNKTGEYKQGIARIFSESADKMQLPDGIIAYLEAIMSLNSDGELRFYPGSPRIARTYLRPQDRMVLTELHPTDFPLLEQEFHRDRQVTIHQKDGFAHLKATLPPKERRGLVLIDPPYELADEYLDVVKAISQAYKRWATGIYAIWYPVVSRQTINKLQGDLGALGIRKILNIEFGISPDTDERGMTASGMIVINPPWTLESQMQEILPIIKQAIAPQTGFYKIDWLVEE